MKAQLLLPMTIAVSVALVVVMKSRRQEEVTQIRRSKFENMKLRVTHDVLEEYQKENIQTSNQLEKLQNDLKVLEDEVTVLQSNAQEKKGLIDVCQEGQVWTPQISAKDTRNMKL